MATVRQSITALYEQSRKSATEGQPMFAVIESASAASTGLASHDDRNDDDGRAEAAMMEPTPTAGDAPSIARRFDELRELADREAGDTGVAGYNPSNSGILDSVIPMSDQPLPSEPPAPASGDTLSELDVANIQQLVQQAWEDEPALAALKAEADHDAEPEIGGQPEGGDQPENVADPHHDIDTAMEEIAAAVVKSGTITPSVDLPAIKAELVAAMRAELQDVLAADLRPMIKAAIAEAMQDLPAKQSKTRTRKTTAKKKTDG
jgi:hypothetical protein